MPSELNWGNLRPLRRRSEIDHSGVGGVLTPLIGKMDVLCPAGSRSTRLGSVKAKITVFFESLRGVG